MVKKFKIDLKDRKILSELDWDARISYAEIGRRVGLPKNVVEYRVKQLESQGIIEGYYPIIDFMKLGYHYCRLLIKLQYLDSKTYEKLINYLIKNQTYNWVISTIGEYDLAIGIWTRTIQEFRSDIFKLVSKFDKNIKSRIYSIATKLEQYPNKFILPEAIKNESWTIKETIETAKLNDLEKKVLRLLTYNARKSLTELGEELEINYKSIDSKIKSLIKKRILVGTRSLINYEKLGQIYYKIFIHITHVDENKVDKIKEYLRNRIEVIYLVEESGICDIDAEVIMQNNEEFLRFIKDIKDKFGEIIKEINHIMFHKTIKVSYLPKDI